VFSSENSAAHKSRRQTSPQTPRENASRVADANLLNTLPNRRHRLPVLRHLTALYEVKLKSGLAPCRERKTTQIIERSAPKFNGFGMNYYAAIIQNIVWAGQANKSGGKEKRKS